MWRGDTSRATNIYAKVKDARPYLRLRLLVLFFALVCVPSAGFTQQADSNCWAATKQDVSHDLSTMAQGWRSAPTGIIKPHNLKWELPIAAATGVLIAWVDVPAANRVHSATLASDSGRASNILLGSEIGAAGLTYAVGCATHRSGAREGALTALAGMGYAVANDFALKAAFNRQYPYTANGRGEFWEGGKSFPSGHASASWGMASALAARYPNRPLLKWSGYAMATGISLLRFPARKHFPSDILVGSTLGFVAGSYLASH